MWAPGGLNPSCSNADDSQVMICDKTLYYTSCGGVIGNMPDWTLGDLGSTPSRTQGCMCGRKKITENIPWIYHPPFYI